MQVESPKIHLTRHGQSLTNVGVYPHLDDENHFGFLHNDNIVLTPEGVAEAGALLDALSPEERKQIGWIVTSPLARAHQTAMIIAGQLGTMVPITLNDGLRELGWHHAVLSAERLDIVKVSQLLEPDPVDRYLTSSKTMMQSSETQRMVFKRVCEAFDAICVDVILRRMSFVAVSHFFPLRAIRAVLEGGGASEMPRWSPPNTKFLTVCPEDFRVKWARLKLKDIEWKML